MEIPPFCVKRRAQSQETLTSNVHSIGLIRPLDTVLSLKVELL